MAVDIIVQRSPADKCGDDIVDPLISTVSVALNRGRNELDDKAEPSRVIRYQIIYRPGLQSGQIIEVHDGLRGISFRGKLVGLHHSLSGGSAITEVAIEKISVFQ
jgi:hypothetical protein